MDPIASLLLCKPASDKICQHIENSNLKALGKSYHVALCGDVGKNITNANLNIEIDYVVGQSSKELRSYRLLFRTATWLSRENY